MLMLFVFIRLFTFMLLSKCGLCLWYQSCYICILCKSLLVQQKLILNQCLRCQRNFCLLCKSLSLFSRSLHISLLENRVLHKGVTKECELLKSGFSFWMDLKYKTCLSLDQLTNLSFFLSLRKIGKKNVFFSVKSRRIPVPAQFAYSRFSFQYTPTKLASIGKFEPQTCVTHLQKELQ